MGNLSQYIAASRVDDVNNPATSHLTFWTGTQVQFEALAVTDARYSIGDGTTDITFTRAAGDFTTIFNDGATVYVRDGDDSRQGVAGSITALSIIITFPAAVTLNTTAGDIIIDQYDPTTLYNVIPT